MKDEEGLDCCLLWIADISLNETLYYPLFRDNVFEVLIVMREVERGSRCLKMYFKVCYEVSFSHRYGRLSS